MEYCQVVGAPRVRSLAKRDGVWTPPSLLHTMTHKRGWAPQGYGTQ